MEFLTFLVILVQRSPEFKNSVVHSEKGKNNSFPGLCALGGEEGNRLSSGHLHHFGDHSATHDMHCITCLVHSHSLAQTWVARVNGVDELLQPPFSDGETKVETEATAKDRE